MVNILIAIWLIGVAFFVYNFTFADHQAEVRKAAVKNGGVVFATFTILIAATLWPILLPYYWVKFHG